MPDIDPDLEDADIPQMAVDALNAAHREALVSGMPVLVVEGDKLVRIDAAGRTVLKNVEPWEKVPSRVKKSTK